jgi:hypothetical protein
MVSGICLIPMNFVFKQDSVEVLLIARLAWKVADCWKQLHTELDLPEITKGVWGNKVHCPEPVFLRDLLHKRFIVVQLDPEFEGHCSASQFSVDPPAGSDVVSHMDTSPSTHPDL